MEILKFPNPILFQKTENVHVFGEELKVLLNEMWETMRANNGMGLAANQVGLPFSMFVMNGPNGRLNIVNPQIVSKSKMSANIKEGCLSSPGEFIIVPDRVDWVQAKFQDENGSIKLATFKGLYSVCFLHELEHLCGKSFMENKSVHRTIRIGLQKKWGIV